MLEYTSKEFQEELDEQMNSLSEEEKLKVRNIFYVSPLTDESIVKYAGCLFRAMSKSQYRLPTGDYEYFYEDSSLNLGRGEKDDFLWIQTFNGIRYSDDELASKTAILQEEIGEQYTIKLMKNSMNEFDEIDVRFDYDKEKTELKTLLDTIHAFICSERDNYFD